jgi:hypothetical protein
MFDVMPFKCDFKKAVFVQLIFDRILGKIRVKIDHKKIGKTYQHDSYMDERLEMLQNFNNPFMISEFHTYQEALFLCPRKDLVQRILDVENANRYMME